MDETQLPKVRDTEADIPALWRWMWDWVADGRKSGSYDLNLTTQWGFNINPEEVALCFPALQTSQ